MPDIEHSIQVSNTPEEAFPFVATAPGLTQWWAADVETPDATVDLGFFNRTTVYRLRLLFAQPSARVEWVCESGDEWNGTHLVFQLEAAKSGATLLFEHSGWRAETDYFRSCNTTWGGLMFRLKAAIEGKNPGPLFTKDGWMA